MFASILDRFFESSSFTKWYIEEFDTIFICVLMPHDEEFFEIFFWTRIQARCIEWDFESCSELRRDVHPHIIAVRTLLSPFWCMLDSLDTREEIPDIIGSLDIRDIFDLTDFYEGFISLVILRFWLDIGIIPETHDIILITKLKYRHRRIRTTADMDEDFRLFSEFRAVESFFEDILRYPLRESWYDEFLICRKECGKICIFWDSFSEFSRRNIGNMRVSEKLKISDSSLLCHRERSVAIQ